MTKPSDKIDYDAVSEIARALPGVEAMQSDSGREEGAFAGVNGLEGRLRISQWFRILDRLRGCRKHRGF